MIKVSINFPIFNPKKLANFKFPKVSLPRFSLPKFKVVKLPTLGLFFFLHFKKNLIIVSKRLIIIATVLSFLIIFLLNLHGYLFPENEIYYQILMKVLKNPFLPNNHILLGKYYLKQGYLQLANDELKLAQELQTKNSGNILGMSDASLKEALQNEQGNINKIWEQIKHWERVVEKKNDFRDGFFQLAILHYQLGNESLVNYYIEKTVALDPNFEPALKLAEIMDKEVK